EIDCHRLKSLSKSDPIAGLFQEHFFIRYKPLLLFPKRFGKSVGEAPARSQASGSVCPSSPGMLYKKLSEQG
ncbi:MAG: hypothetical protein MK441_02200, partial [SAR324 cluster bacterium]|nr:hypothetical protein [SAR324 cluster bacterium]